MIAELNRSEFFTTMSWTAGEIIGVTLRVAGL